MNDEDRAAIFDLFRRLRESTSGSASALARLMSGQPLSVPFPFLRPRQPGV